MGPSRIEQETIINFNEAESTASVYTHNAALRRKLDKLAAERPAEVKLSQHFPDGGVEYTIPKRWVKVNAGPVLTDEQRQALVERGRATRKAQLARKAGSTDPNF